MLNGLKIQRVVVKGGGRNDQASMAPKTPKNKSGHKGAKMAQNRPWITKMSKVARDAQL